MCMESFKVEVFMKDIQYCKLCECYKRINEKKGECRRFPPKLDGKFPETGHRAWCCEFKYQILNEVKEIGPNDAKESTKFI